MKSIADQLSPEWTEFKWSALGLLAVLITAYEIDGPIRAWPTRRRGPAWTLARLDVGGPRCTSS